MTAKSLLGGLALTLALVVSGQAMADSPSVVYQLSASSLKGGQIQLIANKTVATRAPILPGMTVHFVDLKPRANWAHPARIEILNSAGTLVEKIDVRLPPANLKDAKVLSGSEYVLRDHDVQFNIDDFHGAHHVANPAHFYAIMINGAADDRHWNDFSFLYRTLTKVYGYLPENIYVADSNFIQSKPDLDGDGKPDIKYQSTVQGVTQLLTQMKTTLTAEDHVLIATDDHGDLQHGESTLYLVDGEMTATTFAGLANALPGKQVLAIHEPCFSGGLVRPTIMDNRATMAAATSIEESWATKDLNFDEFIYHVISAFAMQTPDGKPVKAGGDDGKVSARQAFAYAVSHDEAAENPVIEDSPDTRFDANIGLDF